MTFQLPRHESSQWECIFVPYLVVHPKANDLGQEGTRKASSDQLFVGSTQGRLIQALAHDAAGKLVHLQTQVWRPVSVWVHLQNRC